jgi:PAS domain S-box-containing protein
MPPGNDETLAALIIENALEYAIFTLDPEGVIMTWSRGAERIFGYSLAEAVGMNFRLLFVEADVAAGAERLELQTARDLGRAEDTRWHTRKDGERFWANGVTMTLAPPGPAGFLKITRDETATKLAEDQRVMLLNELNHRIKNTLSTVQSITEQTLRGRGVDPAIRHDLTDRLKALSEAHNVLVDENWAGANLGDIIRAALAPHERPDRRAFEIDGPAVRLSPHQAVSVSLVLHELATNAVKYGALSVPTGGISVSWNAAVDGMGARYATLLWQEHGGPPVVPPSRRGFGTRLVERSFGSEGGGRARVEYLPEGARCVIGLTLSSPEETPLRL